MSEPLLPGAPAFPFQHQLADGGLLTASGMFLRDYFAGQALTGVSGNQEALSRLTADCHLTGQSHEEAIAQAIYLMADAMLKERAK